MLKPLGGDGAPFNAVGEWLVPLVTERKKRREDKTERGGKRERERRQRGKSISLCFLCLTSKLIKLDNQR